MAHIKIYLKNSIGKKINEFVEAEGIEDAIKKGNELHSGFEVFRVDFKGKKFEDGELLRHKELNINESNTIATKPQKAKPKPKDEPNVESKVEVKPESSKTEKKTKKKGR